ncbi:MAG: DNA alkylation repair protein [Bacteroidales bacterium]
MNASDVKMALQVFADERQAAVLSRFFKTGKGEYGEGDRFMGVRVPQVRAVAKEAYQLPLTEVERLIDDPVHEVRLCGFLILVLKYEKLRDEAARQQIVACYLANARKANNWDLVDLSAPKILGHWLCSHDRAILYQLAESDNLWEQRIAMVATWRIIRQDEYDDTLSLALRLMAHPHDLIRKAVGWMLREVGKRDREVLTGFLDQYATQLSRTSLRYAIEHFSPELRKQYMERKE